MSSCVSRLLYRSPASQRQPDLGASHDWERKYDVRRSPGTGSLELGTVGRTARGAVSSSSALAERAERTRGREDEPATRGRAIRVARREESMAAKIRGVGREIKDGRLLVEREERGEATGEGSVGHCLAAEQGRPSQPGGETFPSNLDRLILDDRRDTVETISPSYCRSHPTDSSCCRPDSTRSACHASLADFQP